MFVKTIEKHMICRAMNWQGLDISDTSVQNIENGKNTALDNVLKKANHFALLINIYDSLSGFEETDSYPSYTDYYGGYFSL